MNCFLMASSFGSSCQPNQPLSPVAFIMAMVSGLRMSEAVQEVMKMLQPPAAGASFLARRATRVCQSMFCRSTLKPACSSCCLATSGSLPMVPLSEGRISTTGSPL